MMYDYTGAVCHIAEILKRPLLKDLVNTLMTSVKCTGRTQATTSSIDRLFQVDGTLTIRNAPSLADVHALMDTGRILSIYAVIIVDLLYDKWITLEGLPSGSDLSVVDICDYYGVDNETQLAEKLAERLGFSVPFGANVLESCLVTQSKVNSDKDLKMWVQ